MEYLLSKDERKIIRKALMLPCDDCGQHGVTVVLSDDVEVEITYFTSLNRFNEPVYEITDMYLNVWDEELEVHTIPCDEFDIKGFEAFMNNSDCY